MFNSDPQPPAPAARRYDAPPEMPQAGGESDVHLLDRLSVVYRYRRLVISIILLVLIGGVVQTFSTVRIYKATATVEIAEERPLASSLRDVQQQFSVADPEVYMTTQENVLRSRDLARVVVKKLDLASHPEFKPGATESVGLRSVFATIRSRVTRPLRQLLQKETPRAAAPVDTAAPQAGASESPQEAALVSAFIGRLNVNRRPLSRLVNVSFDAQDPQLAARAANLLAEEYVVKNLDLKRQSLTDRITLYETEIQKQKVAIEAYQRLLADTQDRLGADAVNDNATMAAATMATFGGEANRARAQMVQVKKEYDQFKPVLDNPEFDVNDPQIRVIPAVAADTEVSLYRSNLNRLERERQAQAELGRGAKHPDSVRIKNDTEQQQTLMRTRIVQLSQLKLKEYQNVEATAQSYEQLYAKAQKDASQASINAVQPGFVVNDLKTAQTLMGNLTAELQQTKVVSNSTENNVRTMDRAEEPSSPYTPNIPNNLIVSLLTGVILALAVAFGLDYLDDTIKTPEDITRKLRIPFLGLVPAVRGDRQPVLSGPVPHDFGEAYRALRTSLVFTSGGERTRVIAVTSAQPLEGKTTTACNLAMVLAFGGSRVLLIDADLRRPGVHKALKMANTVGLSHLLVGQARVREAIQRTSDPNFCVLTAGRTPPNPSELLASERMRQLLANLSEGPFDWVIVDTPPVLAVTDAVIVTPMVSGTVFVLGAEMTRRRLAERAVQMLLQSRPRVIGAVLNRVNFDRNRYYYSRYYGYQYKSYYGQQPQPGENTVSQA